MVKTEKPPLLRWSDCRQTPPKQAFWWGLWYNISMLNKRKTDNRNQIRMVCIEDLVPQDHLLRKIENAIDFGFVYDEAKGLYSSDNGRPSIDPVCLVKLQFDKE